jgi:CRISPR/Cas system Type II protein with McrA/HNH and RuvC-like nuclease domain
VEQRLLTAFAALEMLSWVTEVLEAGMDETKWHDKGAARRLRRLLTRAKVDLRLSRGASPGPLVQFAQAEQQQDAPNALALVRHRVTHPKNPRDLYRFKGLVAEASRLACRYLELAILHRIDYRGHIADRTKLGGWIGECEPAPWTK